MKKKENSAKLDQIEDDLQLLSIGTDLACFSEQRRDLVLALESQKKALLRIKEETIRQKSRVTWLLAGDNNTNTFIILLQLGTILMRSGK